MELVGRWSKFPDRTSLQMEQVSRWKKIQVEQVYRWNVFPDGTSLQMEQVSRWNKFAYEKTS
jgi:hypothetical protein